MKTKLIKVVFFIMLDSGFMTPACELVGASFTGCDKWATVALVRDSCANNNTVYI